MDQIRKQRFFEVDALRGIAIILMVIFHFIFAIDYFGIHKFDMHSGILLVVGRSAAILFLFLVGVSLTLSYSRAKISSDGTQGQFTHYLKRGAGIFGWGMVITVVTATFLERGTIYFGILHLIGVSIILSYPLLKYRNKNLHLGLSFLFAGVIMKGAYANYPWLLFLGVKPYGFYSLDYVPLIPWFGVVLLGIFTGNSLYPDYRRNFYMCDCGENTVVRSLVYLGKKSLLIYLLHGIVIFVILFLFISI